MGRTVLVTGATAGFGAAMARRFVDLGDRVIGTGRRQERLDALRSELGEAFVPLCFDVSDRQACDDALATLSAEDRAVDILVNNAGLALGLGPAWESNLDDWMTMVRTNIDGVLYLTHALLPGMVERRTGHIVNLSSVAANWPYPGGHVYGSTKAFLTQLSFNLRSDLVGTGVRVTSIEPGLCDTEFSTVRFKGDAQAAAKPYADVDAMTADDIAEAVIWAASQPRHVNINRIELMATEQAWAGWSIHRGPLK